MSEISTKQAAKLIGITDGHVRKLLIAEVLKGVKLHQRAWLVDVDSALEFARTPQKMGRPRSAKS